MTGAGLPGDETGIPLVRVIDDDPSVRAALEDLLSSVGLQVRSFGSTQAFLESDATDAAGCLVLDVRMPGQSGLDFQRQMTRFGIDLPVIFITGHGDIAMTARAMKAGAVDFLAKPFDEQALLDAINDAIERDRADRLVKMRKGELGQLFQTLNAGERDVLRLVVKGLLNKQVAAELAVSEITVKVRRSQVMRKLQARSLPELVRCYDQLFPDGAEDDRAVGT